MMMFSISKTQFLPDEIKKEISNKTKDYRAHLEKEVAEGRLRNCMVNYCIDNYRYNLESHANLGHWGETYDSKIQGCYI